MELVAKTDLAGDAGWSLAFHKICHSDSRLLSFVKRPAESWPRFFFWKVAIRAVGEVEGWPWKWASPRFQGDLCVESADAAHAQLEKPSI